MFRELMTISFKNDKQRKAAFYNMKNRSVQALNRDNSVRAAHTLSDTPSNRDLWAANPRRIDIEGIDTPMKRINIITEAGSDFNKDVYNEWTQRQAGIEKRKVDIQKAFESDPKYKVGDEVKINLDGRIIDGVVGYNKPFIKGQKPKLGVKIGEVMWVPSEHIIDEKQSAADKTQNGLKHADTDGWDISENVKTNLDDNDIESLKKSYKFYIDQFYLTSDKVQDIGLWLAYNKYRKDDPAWKDSYQKQIAKESKYQKEAIKYKNHVDDALLKPPNHKDVMADINDNLKLIK